MAVLIMNEWMLSLGEKYLYVTLLHKFLLKKVSFNIGWIKLMYQVFNQELW